jgi:hypothetical protein
VSERPPTGPGWVPWRQRPRGSLWRTSPHLVLAPALLTGCGVALFIEGMVGSLAWPKRLLELAGGLLLTAATIAYWVFVWLYVERPHDRTLDR